MNEWDLFQELSELDEELVLAAEKTPDRKNLLHRGGLRAALIAAIIALLVGTALAVHLGVSVSHGEKTVPLKNIGLSLPEGEETEKLTYYTANIRFDMMPTEITNADLTSALTQAWQQKSDLSSYPLLEENGHRINLGTISGAEKFLGIELIDSPELEPMIRGAYVTLLVTDPERAREQYAREGEVSPDGIELYFSFRRGIGDVFDARQVLECGLTVYIALTEDFARSKNVLRLYSYEKEGAFRESGLLTDKGNSLLLLENSPRKGYCAVGYAAWCEKGIAYFAVVKCSPNAFCAPLSLLTPLLETLQ